MRLLLRLPSFVRIVALVTTLLAAERVAAEPTKNARLVKSLPPSAPRPPEPRSLKQEAKEVAEYAAIQYDLGRFREAAEHYSRAYELYPAPGLLFNLGQCHRQLGDHSKAIFFFEGYLRQEPAASNRKLVEELLAESRAEKRKSEAIDGQRMVSACRELGMNRERPELDFRSFDRTPAAYPQRDKAPPLIQRWWLWTAVAGAAALALGTIGIVVTSGRSSAPAATGPLEVR